MQNFRAKKGTAMAGAPEPPLSELLWSVAAARLLLGPAVSIQAPPNLTPEPDDSAPTPAGGDMEAGWRLLVDAGINDFGVGGWVGRVHAVLQHSLRLRLGGGDGWACVCGAACARIQADTHTHMHTYNHSRLCPGLCLLLTLRCLLPLCFNSLPPAGHLAGDS